jgi:hypothetical protein
MEVFHEISGHLQDLHSDTKGLRQDLDRLGARVDHMDQTLTKLIGTFASIEKMFTDPEQRLTVVEAALRQLKGA